ncbi:MAG: ribosomal protein S18-alanine N-acetyltransferase [Acidiferrobacterales bacterium]
MSAVVSALSPVVRTLRETDLRAVMAIEQASYEFPWTQIIFRDCLRAGYECHAYDSAHGLLGYGIMSVAAGECHLLNICIHPRYRGKYLGTQLILTLLERGQRRRAEIALLEVRVSNKRAYRLYMRLGFSEVGLRKNYYPARHGREDALVLAKDLLTISQGI